MELKLVNGEYVPDGMGGLCRVEGEQELLERILFKLQARRGGFSPLPELGSRLYTLLREKKTNRQSAAEQYIREALEGEAVLLEEVHLTQKEEVLLLEAEFLYNGEHLPVSLELKGVGV